MGLSLIKGFCNKLSNHMGLSNPKYNELNEIRDSQTRTDKPTTLRSKLESIVLAAAITVATTFSSGCEGDPGMAGLGFGLMGMGVGQGNPAAVAVGQTMVEYGAAVNGRSEVNINVQQAQPVQQVQQVQQSYQQLSMSSKNYSDNYLIRKDGEVRAPGFICYYDQFKKPYLYFTMNNKATEDNNGNGILDIFNGDILPRAENRFFRGKDIFCHLTVRPNAKGYSIRIYNENNKFFGERKMDPSEAGAIFKLKSNGPAGRYKHFLYYYDEQIDYLDFEIME